MISLVVERCAECRTLLPIWRMRSVPGFGWVCRDDVGRGRPLPATASTKARDDMRRAWTLVDALITGAVVPSALSLGLAVEAVPGWHVCRTRKRSTTYAVWTPESWARDQIFPDVEGPRADVLAWLAERWAPRAMAWALGERDNTAAESRTEG